MQEPTPFQKKQSAAAAAAKKVTKVHSSPSVGLSSKGRSRKELLVVLRANRIDFRDARSIEDLERLAVTAPSKTTAPSSLPTPRSASVHHATKPTYSTPTPLVEESDSLYPDVELSPPTPKAAASVGVEEDDEGDSYCQVKIFSGAGRPQRAGSAHAVIEMEMKASPPSSRKVPASQTHEAVSFRPPPQREQMPELVRRCHPNPFAQAPSTPKPTGDRKAILLWWCQERTHGSGVAISNFGKSFGDGLAFCAIMHGLFPDKVPLEELKTGKDRRRNFTLAFDVAEEAGQEPFLEVDDCCEVPYPDSLCVMTYLFEIQRSFPL